MSSGGSYLELEESSENSSRVNCLVVIKNNLTPIINVLVIITNVILLSYYVPSLHNKVTELSSQANEYKALFDVILLNYPNITKLNNEIGGIQYSFNNLIKSQEMIYESYLQLNSSLFSMTRQKNDINYFWNNLNEINRSSLNNTIRLINENENIQPLINDLSNLIMNVNYIYNSTCPNCSDEFILLYSFNGVELPINFDGCVHSCYFDYCGCLLNMIYNGNIVLIRNSTDLTLFVNGLMNTNLKLRNIMSSNYEKYVCTVAYKGQLRWKLKMRLSNYNYIGKHISCCQFKTINSICRFDNEDYILECPGCA